MYREEYGITKGVREERIGAIMSVSGKTGADISAVRYTGRYIEFQKKLRIFQL